MPTGDRIRHSILERAPSSEAAVSFRNPPVNPASPLSLQPRTVEFVSAFAGTRVPVSVTCVGRRFSYEIYKKTNKIPFQAE